MQSLYIVRTATVASLTAAFVAFGWVTMQGDDLQPELIVVSSAQTEPAMHFHAGFIIAASVDEPDVKVYEYY
jgi:hypothetical protein